MKSCNHKSWSIRIGVWRTNTAEAAEERLTELCIVNFLAIRSFVLYNNNCLSADKSPKDWSTTCCRPPFFSFLLRTNPSNFRNVCMARWNVRIWNMAFVCYWFQMPEVLRSKWNETSGTCSSIGLDFTSASVAAAVACFFDKFVYVRTNQIAKLN